MAPDQRQVAVDLETAAVLGHLDRGRPEADRLPLQHLVVDRLLDVRLVVVAERLHPPCALPHAHRRRVRVEHEARPSGPGRDLQGRIPPGDVEQQIVPCFGGGSRTAGSHGERRIVGPEPVAPGRERHQRGAYSTAPRIRLVCSGAMAVELEHPFSTARSLDESFATILDLTRVVPCVEGGSVLEATDPASVGAQIKVKMGAMSMTFTGTVEIVEQDPVAHRAVMSVKSRRPAARGMRTPQSSSRSSTAAGRSTRTRRSPARQRRWAKASLPACSTR